VDLEKVIAGCKKDDRKAQESLYKRYAPLFLAMIRRYVKDEMEAEDVLVEAFVKIFGNLDQYSGNGSFEGWMKRIVVNEALMYLRKNQRYKHWEELENVQIAEPATVIPALEAKQIIQLLDFLPDGYRTVFNLYVIEGYKHREIADLLGISINTSKSQLILAKQRMKQLIENKLYSEIPLNSSN